MGQSSDDNQSVVLIDEQNLGKECVRQPKLYWQAANNAADARLKVANRKAELDVLEADLQRRIRATPVKYGCDSDGKLTEKAISSALVLQEEYQEAESLVTKAIHHAALCDALVQALEQKKRSLTLLVELRGQRYYADVKASPEGRDAVKEDTKSKTFKRQQEKMREDRDA